MNATNKHFTFHGKLVNETEFIKEVLLSCYLIISVLKDEEVETLDPRSTQRSIDLVRGYLNKIESLELDPFQRIKAEHYSSCCVYYEKIIAERLEEQRKLLIGFITVMAAILAAVVVCYILRG